MQPMQFNGPLEFITGLDGRVYATDESVQGLDRANPREWNEYLNGGDDSPADSDTDD